MNGWLLTWLIGMVITLMLMLFKDGYSVAKGETTIFDEEGPLIFLFIVIVPALWPLIIGIILPGIIVWEAGKRTPKWIEASAAKKKEKKEALQGHFMAITVKEKG